MDVRAVPEGTVFRPSQPVLEITGTYNDFCRLETPILGLMCQASGVATKAARCRIAAEGRQLVSFGARRIHPAIAPMVERAAYIGGCDGVALVKGAELLEIPAAGTMPHALVILMGGLVPAAKAFDEVIEPEVGRVALVDTFGDERFETLEAARALTDRLSAVRVDTPASRRGNIYQILEEIRWELDRAGFPHVKLFVSGGLDEQKILELNPVVDGGYGVGTSVSAAATIDFSMDIVEVDGEGYRQARQAAGRETSAALPRLRGGTRHPDGQALRRLRVVRRRDGATARRRDERRRTVGRRAFGEGDQKLRSAPDPPRGPGTIRMSTESA